MVERVRRVPVMGKWISWSRKSHRLVLLCALAAFHGSPCLAVDAYRQGADSYRRGDYRTALSFLLRAASTYPNNAAVHYQLANTYLQLHRRSEAKNEYVRCLTLNPDPTTADYCRRMVAFLGGGQISRGSSMSRSEDHQLASAGSSSSGTAYDSPQEKAAMERERLKEQILMKAAAEARAIREEAEQRIKEISETTNQLVIDRETGEVSTGISAVEAKAIRDEAEARARQILWQAEDRVKHL
jgi:tetratricopeptide (TPR) repeat protein